MPKSAETPLDGSGAAPDEAPAVTKTVGKAADVVVKAAATEPADAYAVAIPFLKLCGYTLGGWLLARSAGIAQRQLASGASDRQFLSGKIASARFYADHVLPQVRALARVVEVGASSVAAVGVELI